MREPGRIEILEVDAPSPAFAMDHPGTQIQEPPPLAQGARAETGLVIQWRVHLAARQPARAAAAAGAALAAGAWAALVFGNPLMGAAATLLLLAAVAEFLFPVTYRLSPSGAEARALFLWRKIAWTELRRVYVREGEVKLSPLAHGGPREAFRGVLLRCEGNQAAVQEAVRGFRAAVEAASPSGTSDLPECKVGMAGSSGARARGGS